MNSTWRVPAMMATLGLVAALGGCGSDDDEATPATTTAVAATDPIAADPGATEPAATDAAAPGGSVDPEFAEYCALSLELDQQQDLPTAEQMETILAAAPDAISAEAKTVVDAYVAAGADDFTVFVEHAEEMAVIESFDAEQCGIVSDEEPVNPEVVQIDPDATRVDVTGADFMFDFEPPTAVGRYSFVMQNEGEELHMMILAKLEPSSTLEEAMASEGEEGIAESFESVPAAPGDEAIVTADLSPGHWVLVCPIPSEANDMQPHAALGMAQEWDVT